MCVNSVNISIDLFNAQYVFFIVNKVSIMKAIGWGGFTLPSCFIYYYYFGRNVQQKK